MNSNDRKSQGFRSFCFSLVLRYAVREKQIYEKDIFVPGDCGADGWLPINGWRQYPIPSKHFQPAGRNGRTRQPAGFAFAVEQHAAAVIRTAVRGIRHFSRQDKLPAVVHFVVSKNEILNRSLVSKSNKKRKELMTRGESYASLFEFDNNENTRMAGRLLELGRRQPAV
ncbi:MAG TPA: hypothetical protein VFV23_15075 [Verrucomicrobiae bacterium]|nr:hypothetical protein [Verrucomicrobiae bacterium]